MRDHARIVIVGAGIVGCSVAYHLAQLGWRDVVVVDKGDLFENDGSTSHAPGGMFLTNASRMMTEFAKYSRTFYARGQTQRYQIIAFERSFHGRTLGALAATGQAGYREGFGPLVGVTHVPFGDADAVAAKLDDSVAGVLVEPVQGEGGVSPAPPGFLKRLRALTDKSGALLLGDEIQTGIGRTGKFLGFEHEGVRPDAIALAKGLGGGVPIGAMLCQKHLENALPPGSHGSTFGGNPLAAAVARVALRKLASASIANNVARQSAALRKGLDAIDAELGLFSQVRGRGLMLGAVLQGEHAGRAGEILDHAAAQGLLLLQAGPDVLRFVPALNITDEELAEGLERLQAALRAFVAR